MLRKPQKYLNWCFSWQMPAFKAHFSFSINWCLKEKFHLLLKWTGVKWLNLTFSVPKGYICKQRQGPKALTYLKEKKATTYCSCCKFPNFLEQKSRTPLMEEMTKDENNQWCTKLSPSTFHCFPNKILMSSQFFWSCPLPAQKPTMFPVSYID